MPSGRDESRVHREAAANAAVIALKWLLGRGAKRRRKQPKKLAHLRAEIVWFAASMDATEERSRGRSDAPDAATPRARGALAMSSQVPSHVTRATKRHETSF